MGQPVAIEKQKMRAEALQERAEIIRRKRIRTMLRIRNRFDLVGVAVLLASSSFVLLLGGSFTFTRAQQTAQKTFPSAEAACAALVTAVQEQDQLALTQILGPSAKGLISDDHEEELNSRRQFVEKYREMHRLVSEPDGRTILYIGAENWPVPIVLARSPRGWSVDPIASSKEVLVRRIGRNELMTIEVCRELVKAQNEYYADSHDGDVKQFAPRFLSDDGRHNGLYWKISEREPKSPVGQLLTLASLEDAKKQTTEPQSFHGYYFRILTKQGPHARGGAKNYIVNGKLTGGFAFVAYPAKYKSSGVMTFIVNRDGVVYQKDLGARTLVRASALTQYDPDATWKKVE
jgi:hypothetical protein